MDMEKLHEFADILTQKEEECNATVEQAANALTEKELLKQSEMEYLEAKASGDVRSEKEYGNLTIIELTKSRFGIKCNAGFIVPFGKYEWIEGFDHGLSRVRTHGLTGYTKNIRK